MAESGNLERAVFSIQKAVGASEAHLKDLKRGQERIDKHLESMNGRLRHTENSISWIWGIGSAITVFMGLAMTYLGWRK